ncbi:YlbF family regulator [Thermoactinomyces mirandus]|uniref:YlbF family regulator n=1 Tax=Thermoactinomyces mirandus TaxID=2756294 RepID=A0A7W2AQL4_9BACL|nr:YlbF family regulator [Thermoactinomyces mirandus]MBA4601417.1 YlbF family regulator [Thermoactinomyces mirandus]
MATLDMSTILLEAYQLADEINESQEVKEYLKAKENLDNDPEAQKMIQEFYKANDRFEEAKRFGNFHPDYKKAKEQALALEKKIHEYPSVHAYLEAEKRLDQLLHQVSLIIARSVSKSVKVPGND